MKKYYKKKGSKLSFILLSILLSLVAWIPSAIIFIIIISIFSSVSEFDVTVTRIIITIISIIFGFAIGYRIKFLGITPEYQTLLMKKQQEMYDNARARTLEKQQRAYIAQSYTSSSKDSSYVEEKIKCPNCESTQLTANKKGFGLGKAVAGGIVTGGVGLLSGFIGSGKVRITCLKCGYSWTAGKN